MLRAIWPALLLACIALPALARPPVARELIRDRVAQLPPAPPGDRPGAWLATGLRKFYEDRKFEPAWTPANLDALIAALRGLEEDGLNPADYQLAQLRERRSVFNEDAARSAARRADLDLVATRSCLLALLQLSLGKVDPAVLDPEWNFEPRAFESKTARHLVREALEQSQVAQMFDHARPQHPAYAKLRAQLRSLHDLEHHGGWPKIADGPPLKPGMKDPRVAALRRRLVLASYLPPKKRGSLELYDPPLEAAVKKFQQEQYLDDDGRLGPSTRAALNLSVRARIAQLRANLERARWLLPRIQGDLVVVDIAGYKVLWYEDGKPVWSSRVQVGRTVRPTPIFEGKITFLTFNPTWTVPETILREDVLPKVRADQGYLAANRIRVVNASGKEIPPESLDWSAEDGPAHVWLKQDPGPDNAIGRVRINFPNLYGVYMHETPHAALFEKDQRAFSSGCIRVEDAVGLAEHLLGDADQWNHDALAQVLDAGQTREVGLRRPMRVLLLYWTVDVQDDGRVTYKPDVYGLDAPLLKALDSATPPVRAVGDRST
jgi:murein L,D-transpeptidase YcbB/YkuD